jgi:hypothetical protein
MTMDSTPAIAARGLRLMATMVAVTLWVAACDADQPEAARPATTAAAPEVAAYEPAPRPVSVPVAEPDAPSPMPPASPDDVEFAGWFIDQGGSSQLLACGQSMALPIANPEFLRELKGKLGRSGNAPVYVRLRVRLATGSRLEVSEVLQFGVDETPVVDCVLNR